MCYVIIEHDRHLRTLETCRKHELQASVFYTTQVIVLILAPWGGFVNCSCFLAQFLTPDE